MDPQKQREIASKGGKSLPIEVRREIGRKGGMARAEKLRKNLALRAEASGLGQQAPQVFTTTQ